MITITLDSGEELNISYLGVCRLEALCQGVMLIWEKSNARGIPDHKIEWTKNDGLHQFIEDRGNSIYNTTYTGND